MLAGLLVAACSPPAGDGGAPGDWVDASCVEEVELTGVEPAVAERLETRRRALADALPARGGGAIDRGAAAAAAGELGRAYLAYGFGDRAEACLASAERLAPEDPAWPYTLGFAQQVGGDFAAAAESFGRALALDPEDAAARIRRGRALVELSRLDAAAADFERALAAGAGYRAAALEGLGRVALEAGRPAEAAEHLRAALAAEPGASALRHNLARALRELGDEEAARAELERAGTAGVGFPDPRARAVDRGAPGGGLHLARAGVALAEGRLEVALDELGRAVEARPDDAEARRLYGETLAAAGRVDDAWREIRAGLDLAPDDPALRRAAGLVLAHRGESEAAIEALRRAVEAAPDWSVARQDLARELARAERADEALAAYDELLVREPGRGQALYERAALRLESGDAAGAEADLEALLTADPGAARARLLLGEALQRQERLAEAAAAYEAALEGDLDDGAAAAAHLGAGNLRAAAGRAGEALSHYDRALERRPGLAEARRNRAALLAGLARHGEAAEEYGRLVALGQGTVADRLRRATSLLAAGDAPAALDEARAVLDQEPDSEPARLLAAEALGRSGRWSESRALLERGVESRPESAALVHALARLLASCPDAAQRDGRRAAELALALMSRESSLPHAETVAMALAEAGRFDEAAEWQSEILRRAREAGAPAQAVAALEANLARYRRSEACCAPPR